MSDQLSAEVRALILSAVIGEAEKEVKELKKSALHISYPLPSSATFESPLDGAKLGYVQRARTTPVWKVESPEQLLEYFTREYPEVLETVFLLEVPGVAAPVALPEDHPITQALAQVAPELLAAQERVPEEVVVAALAQSRATGEPAAPGIQLIRPGQGNLNVVYDKKEAVGAIARMSRAGLIDWSSLLVIASAAPKAVAS